MEMLDTILRLECVVAGLSSNSTDQRKKTMSALRITFSKMDWSMINPFSNN